MDKRTIMALGVIGLIFVLLPFYWEWIGFSKKPDPGSEIALSDSVATLTDPLAPDSIAAWGASTDSTGTSTDAQDTLPEQFTTAETDLYTARFSNRGATLASFKLKRFHYLDGTGPVEMVHGHSGYPLHFDLPEANLVLDQVTFTPSTLDLKATGGPGDSVTLTFDGRTQGGTPVRVEYTIRPSSYLIGLSLHLGREAELARSTRLDIGWRGGLAPTEQNRSDDYSYFSAYVRQAAEVAKFNDFDDGKLREGSTGAIDWVGTKSKYFLVALIRTDDQAEDFEVAASETSVMEAGQEVKRREFSLRLGNRLEGSKDPSFELYLGPVDYNILGAAGRDLDHAAEMGYWLFRPFAVAILWFVSTLHKVVPSYGLVIVIFTVVMKMILFPFSRKNYLQMHRMKSLQPKLKEIQEKYREDAPELNRRTMKLYKDEKFNPLGGCMWMLPQLPIFWALFTVFKSYIELRGVGFLWLTDLSQSNQILCGIMALAMLGQQLLTNKDPKQRFLVFGMPVLMFFFFRSLPSGLVLYWTVYNILSIVEQWSVERRLPPITPAVVPAEAPRKSAKK